MDYEALMKLAEEKAIKESEIMFPPHNQKEREDYVETMKYGYYLAFTRETE